jgi:hypothetical protein
MKSIDGFEKRLIRLSVGHHAALNPLVAAWMASLSGPELSRLGTILVHMDDGHEPVGDDLEFLLMLAERPVPPLPPVDHSAPMCNICGGQPAREHDEMLPMCERCYDAAGGNLDITKLRKDTHGKYLA